jgi:hypothetical protein
MPRPRPAARLPPQRAAQRLDPLPHPGEAVALLLGAAATVVLDRQPAHSIGGLQLQPASRRLGMADDIGHRLAHRQRQHALLRRLQRHGSLVALHRDARRLQRRPRLRQLRHKPIRTIAADRLPHLGQSLPRRLLDIGHLRLRPRRIALRQLRRQLRLQHNDRERVPQNVVQVACDPLALGDLRQVLDLLLRADQFFLRPPPLREIDVQHADHHRQADIDEPRDRRLAQQEQFESQQPSDAGDVLERCGGLLLEREKRSGVDEKAARAAVRRQVRHPQRRHAAGDGDRPPAAHPVEPEVERQEDHHSQRRPSPGRRARVVHDRIDQKEAEIAEQRVGRPSHPVVFRHQPHRRLPRLPSA